MSDSTRIARVQPSVAPLRSVGGTLVFGAPAHTPPPGLSPVDLQQLFDRNHRALASAVREERRPGLFVFAQHRDFGAVGRLWLAASDEPRAGTLGRHDQVDLALPLDDSLSLRHLLFVVRRVRDVVHTTVLDLASSRGVRLAQGQELRRVDLEGAACLRLGEFALLCVPTGAEVPWNPSAPSPFATLKQGNVTRSLPRAGRALADGALGRLDVNVRGAQRAFGLSLAALRRGVLLGRDGRCELVIASPEISRVHLALLEVDHEVLLVDTGSANGVWAHGRRVECEAAREGEPYLLGPAGVQVRWALAH